MMLLVPINAASEATAFSVVSTRVLVMLEFKTADGRAYPIAVTVNAGRGGHFASLTEPRTGRAILDCFAPCAGVTRSAMKTRGQFALDTVVQREGAESLARRIEDNWRRLPWLNPPREPHA